MGEVVHIMGGAESILVENVPQNGNEVEDGARDTIVDEDDLSI